MVGVASFLSVAVLPGLFRPTPSSWAAFLAPIPLPCFFLLGAYADSSVATTAAISRAGLLALTNRRASTDPLRGFSNLPAGRQADMFYVFFWLVYASRGLSLEPRISGEPKKFHDFMIYCSLPKFIQYPAPVWPRGRFFFFCFVYVC